MQEDSEFANLALQARHGDEEARELVRRQLDVTLMAIVRAALCRERRCTADTARQGGRPNAGGGDQFAFAKRRTSGALCGPAYWPGHAEQLADRVGSPSGTRNRYRSRIVVTGWAWFRLSERERPGSAHCYSREEGGADPTPVKPRKKPDLLWTFHLPLGMLNSSTEINMRIWSSCTVLVLLATQLSAQEPAEPPVKDEARLLRFPDHSRQPASSSPTPAICTRSPPAAASPAG